MVRTGSNVAQFGISGAVTVAVGFAVRWATAPVGGVVETMLKSSPILVRRLVTSEKPLVKVLRSAHSWRMTP